jgi:hypothetical protein
MRYKERDHRRSGHTHRISTHRRRRYEETDRRSTHMPGDIKKQTQDIQTQKQEI